MPVEHSVIAKQLIQLAFKNYFLIHHHVSFVESSIEEMALSTCERECREIAYLKTSFVSHRSDSVTSGLIATELPQHFFQQ
jgi:hypothetical protein